MADTKKKESIPLIKNPHKKDKGHGHGHSHGHGHGHGHSHGHSHGSINSGVKRRKIKEHGHGHGHGHGADHNGHHAINITETEHKPNYNGMIRLTVMLVLYILFFFAEIGVGVFTRSLALISDAMHMLSDGLSILVAMLAIYGSQKKRIEGSSFTYGFSQSNSLGALINAVFLMAIALFIAYESVDRFIDIEEIKQPLLLVWIGIGGIVINVIGIVMFAGNATLHGHSHGGGDHGHGEAEGARWNLHGVFLHILGDFFGSISVIASGLSIHFIKHDGKYYIDPALSILIAAIILCSAIPLFIKTTKNLLLSTTVDMDLLNHRLKKVENATDIHEVHLLTLGSGVKVATIHFVCDNEDHILQIISDIKAILHEMGVHASTIQPEIGEVSCTCSISCDEDTCCSTGTHHH